MAYNSTITQKKCKCSPDCNLYPDLGFRGYSRFHLPEKEKEILEVKKKRKNALKSDLIKLRNTPDIVEGGKPPKDYAVLDRWFKERQKEMTGRCANCSGKSEKYSQMYKCSIAHLLPKKLFKSVATHPDNWIELCFYGNSCHTNFDNHMIDWVELNCFDTVIKKFAKIYPDIAESERRHIPAVLMEYLKVEL